ncbi:MAG: GGDEF domain-containing phosphodiesterase [Betaproteobacteria bacterium]
MSGADPAADSAAFLQSLNAQIARRQADGRMLAVLLIECGLVGQVDAVWGYHIGDAVRGRVMASLGADVLRPGDFVGDMARDDFACLLSVVEGPAVAVLAAEKALRALNTPFWIGDDEVFANPSIGIVMFPEHGDEAHVLLQRAKSACVLARELTGHIADYADVRGTPAADKLLHDNRLRTAVAEDALELLFQPQYDLRLGQIMGVECRLCWRDPALGTVSEEQAFAAAESAGKVTELLSSVLNRGLRNVSEFRYNAGMDLRLCVRLPARALLHQELPDVVQRALGTWSLRAGRLNLEIAEIGVLGTDEGARQTLVRLKEIGVKLVIDDPGMALSSLFWLATLPFQEIKLDVSAVHDEAAGPRSERILQSIIELAHHLKLDVNAGGVGDEAAAARLKELGCDYMQADYRGPALPAAGFVERYGLNED